MNIGAKNYRIITKGLTFMPLESQDKRKSVMEKKTCDYINTENIPNLTNKQHKPVDSRTSANSKQDKL